MSIRKATDDQILLQWQKTPSTTECANHFNMAARAMATRVNRLRSAGHRLHSKDKRSQYYGESEVWGHWQNLDQHPGVISIDVKDGMVLIGSDSHYHPGIISTAHRAFVHFCQKYKPQVVIKNGDELDGARISRFAPIGWENRPSLVAEMEAVKERLTEIELAAPGANRLWPCGNHDARFETRLATLAPEYAKIHGVHLKDHFPLWKPCWEVLINKSVVVKHRMKGGTHATRTNTLNAGRTVVTGHLHSLKVAPLTDLNGTRWGVDTGTMADPYGPQFYNYTEMSALDWRSGFAVLTFRNGELLWPEVAFVKGPGVVDFRGELISV